MRRLPVSSFYHQAGFTLLEVLVALVIVGTALGASLRAVGSLTQNSSKLNASMLAAWAAENQLTQMRLAHLWPAIGKRVQDCPQGTLPLLCEEQVSSTPNVRLRRVDVRVLDADHVQLASLSYVVSNAP